MNALVDQLNTVIIGKRDVLIHLVAAVVAGGHVLIEDIPGLGKTTLAKALCAALSPPEEPLSFHRIQFTPDLLPYDVTGVDVFDPGRKRFFFHPGPVFTHFLLADEINRATPKVQSALLEVMAESQVTVGGTRYPMDPFFQVIATENPVEMEGTYPLPLAQLDRFAVRLSLGYPDRSSELAILDTRPAETRLPALAAVSSRSEILELRKTLPDIHVSRELMEFVVDLVRRTRGDDRVRHGVSPRGALALVQVGRSLACVRGRDYVVESDLMEIAVPVLAHRMQTRDGFAPDSVVREAAEAELERLYRGAS